MWPIFVSHWAMVSKQHRPMPINSICLLIGNRIKPWIEEELRKWPGVWDIPHRVYLEGYNWSKDLTVSLTTQSWHLHPKHLVWNYVTFLKIGFLLILDSNQTLFDSFAAFKIKIILVDLVLIQVSPFLHLHFHSFDTFVLSC